MKRLIYLTTAFYLIFSMIGCSKKNEDASNPQAGNTAPKEPKTNLPQGTQTTKSGNIGVSSLPPAKPGAGAQSGGHITTPGTIQMDTSDLALKTKVINTLIQKGVQAKEIDCYANATNGSVRLMGNVDTKAEKVKAVAVVKAIPGIKLVNATELSYKGQK